MHLLGDQVVVAWPNGEPIRIRQRLSADRLSLKIRKSKDWFEIDGSAELDAGLVMSLQELLDHVRGASTRFLPLGDKEFVALTERFRKRVEELSAFAESRGNHLRFPAAKAHALDALVEAAGSVDADEHWAKRVARIREAQMLDPVVPSTLQAQLRDYQVEGFRWAARLAAWGAGACLADDMGLGKTIQALAVAVSRAPNGPAIVVAPTSVCANWIDEARRFAPTLNPIHFGPGNREETLRDLKPFDLLVCSYGLLHQESAGLAEVNWETIVLDEAQAIKNRETLRSCAVMRLPGDFRMITTATPIENHLGELWNLFHFINPGLLGSPEAFNENFARPIHVEGSSAARNRLKQLIAPFILRRTKSDVLDELPARTEITQRIEMTREERALYEAVRQRAVEHLEAEIADADGSHVRILAEIMKLRRACCHPQLVMPGTDIAGSKLARFLETVAELIDNAHKALVFSQFTGPPPNRPSASRPSGHQLPLPGWKHAGAPAQARSGRFPVRGRGPVPYQLACRRSGLEPHRRRLRDSPGPLVEPGSGGPSLGPRAPHRPDQAGDDLPAGHEGHHRRKDRGPAQLEAGSRGQPSGRN